MNKYWDLTNEERGKLSEDEVRATCKVELMEQGVINPTPPTLLDETAPSPSTRMVYDVFRKGDYSYEREGVSCDVVFESEEQARAFMDLEPMRLYDDHGTGTRYAKACIDLRVVTRDIAEESDVVKLRAVLEEAKQAKVTNDKAKVEYEKALTVAREAVEGIWEDWHACRERLTYLKRVRETYREYLDLTEGDEATAKRFLLKTYSDEDCQEALPGESFEPVAPIIIEKNALMGEEEE